MLDRLLREPDNGRELLAEAYLLRGRVAAGSGDLLGAEAQFRRALELRPAAEIADPRGQEAAALEAARKTRHRRRAAPGAGAARRGRRPASRRALDVKVEGDGEKMVATLELGYRAGDAGAFLTTRGKPPTPLEVPAAGAPGRRARRLLRARARRARRRAGRERHARRCPSACRWRRRPALAAARRGDAPTALVRALVGLDDRGRGRDRRRRRDLRRDTFSRRRRPPRHPGSHKQQLTTMSTRRLITLSAAVALASAACSSAGPTPGLRVDLSLNGLTPNLLEISVSASPHGFEMASGSTPTGITLSNETDASGEPTLVIRIQSPAFTIPNAFSFRIETENTIELTASASALAFTGQTLVGRADSAAVKIPAGGENAIALDFMMRSGQIVPDTKTTDLKTTPPAVVVQGAQPPPAGGPPRLATVVICDLNGDGYGDLVVGAPNFDDNLITAAGAVYAVLGSKDWIPTPTTTIDSANPPAGKVLTLVGEQSADHFGAALACVDIRGTAALVVGAPGAGNGQGKVYLFYGRQDIATAPPTPATADVRWTSSVDNAALGTNLFAGDVDGKGKIGILVSAPGTQVVHLLTTLTGLPPMAVLSVETADHATFTGIAPSALGAGDLNADNLPDIVLGDSEFFPTNAPSKTGVVYAFADVDLSGATSYAVGTASQTIVGPASSQFGSAVLVLNTSGYGADLFVGAPGDNQGAGTVYVFTGDADFFHSATADPMAVRYSLAGPQPGGRFGTAMAASFTGAAGSGSANLVVGAPSTSRGDRQMAGAAYFFGHGADRAFPLLDQVYGATASDQLGTAVAGGSINGGSQVGDTLPDLAALAQGRPATATPPERVRCTRSSATDA